jgi:predicted HTH domain antitoxin
MSLEISDDLIRSAGLSKDEMALEIAVMLFQKDRLTLAQAAGFAQMNRLQFQHLLASRQIPVHYDEDDFQDDLKTLQDLGRL